LTIKTAAHFKVASRAREADRQKKGLDIEYSKLWHETAAVEKSSGALTIF